MADSEVSEKVEVTLQPAGDAPIMKQRKIVKKIIGNQGDKKNKKLHSFP